MTKTPSEKEIQAFKEGKLVSDEFLNELETRTTNLLTQLKERWNPDVASGDELNSRTADSLPTKPNNR
jgi:hypothetical protein